MYVCTCVPGAKRGQKRVLDSLGLELLVVMSHHVGAMNWIRTSGTTIVFFIAELSLQPQSSGFHGMSSTKYSPPLLSVLQNLSINCLLSANLSSPLLLLLCIL